MLNILQRLHTITNLKNKDVKEYWKQLVDECSIELPKESTDEQVHIWAEKDEEQREYLLNNYGESSWNIWRFMELCRAEDISESMFRQLVRYEMDKNRKLK